MSLFSTFGNLHVYLVFIVKGIEEWECCCNSSAQWCGKGCNKNVALIPIVQTHSQWLLWVMQVVFYKHAHTHTHTLNFPSNTCPQRKGSQVWHKNLPTFLAWFALIWLKWMYKIGQVPAVVAPDFFQFLPTTTTIWRKYKGLKLWWRINMSNNICCRRVCCWKINVRKILRRKPVGLNGHYIMLQYSFPPTGLLSPSQ